MSAARDNYSAAVEDAVKLDNEWPQVERLIRDHVPDLQAASYDGEPGDPEVWCDHHGRPVAVCHRHDELCRGVPLEKRTDPTGDGAVGNRAYEDAGRWVYHAKQVAHHVNQMVRIRNHYTETDPRASKQLEQENDGSGCEVCARSGKWVAKAASSDANGALPRALDLCAWHQRFALDHGRLPNTDEEATHQRGKRVTVRVKQMDRLRSALLAGKL